MSRPDRRQGDPGSRKLASLNCGLNWENDTSRSVVSIGESTTMKRGDQVKVSARGKFAFTVEDVDEDTGMAMIEVNADSPLTYPWPARVSDLVPVES